MKKCIGNIIKLVIFIILTLFLVTKVGKLFILKGWYDDYQGQIYSVKGFDKLPNNQIDVLFIGASTIGKSVLPMQIYEETGITSYNYNVTSARVYMDYYFLQHALKTQKPKIVFLDIVTLFYDTREIETEQRKSFDYLELDDVKFKMINDDVFDTTFEEKVSYFFPLLRYHARWNEITFDEIRDYNKNYYSISKGPLINARIKANNKGYNYMIPSDKKPVMQKYTEDYLNKFVKLCEENNISLVLLAIPDTRAWNYESSLEMQKIAEKYNIEFLDFNDKINYPVNWKYDTHDGGMHFNISGAEKITKYVTNYLNTNYSLPDHRKDNNYKNWNEDLKEYNKKIEIVHKIYEKNKKKIIE